MHSLPLPWRTPTERLLHARQDHAVCLRLAAFYRVCLARGEDEARERHAWALGHARVLRSRFPHALSSPRASPG